MVKISAKLMKNHKAVKNITYMSVNEYKHSDFYFYVAEICRKLDLSTPIIVSYHSECYESFNSVKFTGDDFMDNFPYDYLFLENEEE